MIEVKPLRDATVWLDLLDRTFGGLERRSLEELRKTVDFSESGSDQLLLAELNGTPAGCLWIRRLPSGDRWEFRDLSVPPPLRGRGVEEALIEEGLRRVLPLRPALVRGITIPFDYLVSAYEGRGFKPVRRLLRIVWDPPPEIGGASPPEGVHLEPLTPGDVEGASSVLARSLSPHWDWFIGDLGGPPALRAASLEWLASGGGLTWVVAKSAGSVVGLAGFYAAGGEAQLAGVFVREDQRGRGVGRSLLLEVLGMARGVGVERVAVNTVAYLDRLAPGASLYLKHGGVVEAEYVHLEFGR